MLELKNVKKIYETKAGEVNALNGVTLTFPERGLVFITGKSGCGKTTMLNVIGGLDGVDEGEISVLGKDFSSFTPAEYDDYRNTFIGFIFQEYNLLSEFTVEKNIKIAMELQGREADEAEFDELLKKVDIYDLKHRKPSELSGGQRQRVAIARALVKEPRIIMADEPTGALDSNTGVQVLETLKKLAEDKLIIVVSHDMELSERYADRIIRLVDGKVAEDITFTENQVETNVRSSEDTVIVRNGADLTESEKDELASAIKARKKIEVIERLTYREKRETGEVKSVVAEGGVHLKKSKMKMRSSVALGVKSLAVKPLRLVFTIILSAVAFAVFGLFDTVASFNNSRVIDNLLRTSSSSTVVASGKYVLDEAGGDEYAVKMSDALVDRISLETGYSIKGIYDFDYNLSGYTSNTYPINEIMGSTVREGTGYYLKNIMGIIEFKKSEIRDGKYLGSFGFEVVKGRYPELVYYESGNASWESRREIAISTYLAEAILHYLDGATLNGAEIEEIGDLVDKKINIKSEEYTIVGLIDCGDIPEKYEPLKTSTATREETRALTADFMSYIYSGAHCCMFVGEGFRAELQKDNNRGVLYFTGMADWCITSYKDPREKDADEFMYSASHYDKNNVIFFNESQYGANGEVSLEDDEVLIHPSNLESALFALEISGNSSTLSQTEKNEIKALIRLINSSEGTVSLEDKKEAVEKIFDYLDVSGEMRERVLKVSKKTKGAGEETQVELKAVGVYFGIDNDSSINGTVYRFMANDNLIQSLGGFVEQGEYSRLIFPSKGTLFGPGRIAEYMSSEDGFALVWFGNSALSTIKANESTIKQAADLFLYIALVLALFSMFMLFNYITTSIVSKRQTIGVLRGLGSGGKDIFLMFIAESLIIAVFNGALASVFAAVGCIFVNMYIINVMNISISFALFGIRQVLVIFGMSILTAVLSSALPISRIAKEKPVDLIRRP